MHLIDNPRKQRTLLVVATHIFYCIRASFFEFVLFHEGSDS